MTEVLHAGPLLSDQFDKAFALIQLAFPDVSLDRWRRHIETYQGGGEEGPGWIAVADEKGYLHGLLAYRVEPDLMCGRSLVGRDVVLAGMAVGRAASCAIEGLSQMAWRNRCDSVHVLLPTYRDDELDRGLTSMKDCLRQSGYIDRGSYYCCRLKGRCHR